MRDARAERRAASQERFTAASKAKTQTPRLTLDTDDGGSLILDSAEIQNSTGQTPLGSMIQHSQVSGSGAGHGGNGGSAGAGGDDAGHGRNPPRQPQQRGSVNTAGGRQQAEMAGLGGGHGDAGAGHVSPPPPPPPAPMTSMTSGTTQPGVTQQIVFREKPKSLKLTKFKGLDDSMPVTMWLKTVRAEVRRQAVTSGVVWQEKQLYHEVAAHLEGEAQRWFATVMESVPEDRKSINTLADMLRTKYMGQRTGPELVDLLNERRQTRGEQLIEYAQSLREIAERGDAVNLAIPHVGDCGEGYGVGLEAAMSAWDERESKSGRGPLAAATATAAGHAQVWPGGRLGKCRLWIRAGVGYSAEATTKVAENEDRQKYRKVFKTGDGDAQLECALSLEEDTTSATHDGGSAESGGRASSDGDHGAKRIVKSVVNAAGEERRISKRWSFGRESQMKRCQEAGGDRRGELVAGNLLSRGAMQDVSGADTNGLEDGDAVGDVELPADHGDDGQQAGVVVSSTDEGGKSDEAVVSTEATLQYPEDAYVAFEEMWRRQQSKKPKLMSDEEEVAPGLRQPCSTVMRTVKKKEAPAMDSLPPARMHVGDEWRSVKLDTGAQYSVVGESWKELGEKQSKFPAMSVEALMVEAAADGFLLGEDWMLDDGVKIDFTSCEMKWYSGDDKKIVPFSCAAGYQQPARVARGRQRVPMRTCRNVELAVAASEGTVGLYIPAPDVAPHLLFPPTVTTV
ncbi:hypothetical protein PHMEG_00027082 [Phytophthora megakarya]|uniref:Retrotransposon gag domain-containing protein n=1 Tax=Phytophthora megakarya TaxID=4795 RepID=A0A225V967_9STRA|nr:hypothetical protein PHMEG_00027082 [Phytophthora megakarya]